MAPGAPVLACVRKEHVAIRKLPPGGLRRIRRAGRRGARRVVPRAEEEYVIDLGGVELRAIQAPIGVQAGDRVEVTIRPEDCTVFVESRCAVPRSRAQRTTSDWLCGNGGTVRSP